MTISEKSNDAYFLGNPGNLGEREKVFIIKNFVISSPGFRNLLYNKVLGFYSAFPSGAQNNLKS